MQDLLSYAEQLQARSKLCTKAAEIILISKFFQPVIQRPTSSFVPPSAAVMIGCFLMQRHLGITVDFSWQNLEKYFSFSQADFFKLSVSSFALVCFQPEESNAAMITLMTRKAFFKYEFLYILLLIHHPNVSTLASYFHLLSARYPTPGFFTTAISFTVKLKWEYLEWMTSWLQKKFSPINRHSWYDDNCLFLCSRRLSVKNVDILKVVMK